MTPKSLLRHPEVASQLAEMGPGTFFHRIIDEIDALVADDKVKRVVLCSGKVYYDLRQARRERKIHDVAIIRARAAPSVPGEGAGRVASAATPTPRWCGARRSRRTWAPGPSSTGASSRCWSGSDGKAKRPRYVGRARGGGDGDRAC